MSSLGSNSFDAALNCLALSDIITSGTPRLLMNLVNALMKDGAVESSTSSRCIALIEAQVKRHVQMLIFAGVLVAPCTNNGPA